MVFLIFIGALAVVGYFVGTQLNKDGKIYHVYIVACHSPKGSGCKQVGAAYIRQVEAGLVDQIKYLTWAIDKP